ncbi:MAG: hypothetical protein GX601_15575, partial [Anaerolineales bacterium]|nr:hypothetical protein [Anaerolineales bacterium]
MMIHCAQCGALNRKDRRTCRKCGAALVDEAPVRCPMCGALNAAGALECERCSARLVPLSASYFGDSEPEAHEEGADDHAAETRPDLADEVSSSEDWVSQLRPTPSEDAEPSGEPESLGDDWLSQLRASADEDPLGYGGFSPLDEIEPEGDEAGPVEIPEWLRALGPVSGVDEAHPPASEAAETEPLEAWDEEWASVEQTTDEMGRDLEAGATPESVAPESWWAADLTTPEERANDEAVPAQEAPDWLQGLGDTESPSVTPEPSEPIDWLAEAGAPVEQPGPDLAAAELPDWLR